MLKFGKHHRCHRILTLDVHDERMESPIWGTIPGDFLG